MGSEHDLLYALAPLTERVRTDVTAVKTDDGSRWTRQALTKARLVAHVKGGTPRGVCPIDEDSDTTRVALLDLDSHKGESTWAQMAEAAGTISAALEEAGAYVIPWRSSGGRGIHLYMIWDDPQDAYSVREWIFEALGTVGFKNGAKGVHVQQVEVFPKQDRVAPGEFGNQFILPLAGKSVPLEPLLGYAPLARRDALSVEWAPSLPVPVLEKPVREPSRPVTDVDLQDLQAALSAIPNEDEHELDYDDWRTIVFALHQATGGSDDGLAMAHDFSARSSKYDPTFLDKRVWPYIKDREGGVTAATIFHLAQQNGYVRPGMVAEDDDFEALPDELKDACDESLAAIERCYSAHDLLDKVAPAAGRVGIGSVAVTNILLNALRQKFKDLTESTLPIGEARRSMRPRVDVKAKAKQRRSNTEFGNAERMLDKFGEGLLHAPDTDQWYGWTGTHWDKALFVEIEHRAKQTIRELPDEIDQCRTDEEREAFFKFCAASQRAAMVASVVKLAGSDPRVVVPTSELDPHAHLLGVGNGSVDLRTGKLREPNPDDRITIITDVEYHAEATCPLFEATVSDVFYESKEMIEFFQRLIGYSLTGNPKEDILVIPYGGGSNGKSTVFGTLRRVMGAHAKSAECHSFVTDGKSGNTAGGAREDILRLRGSRFVYVGESEEGAELKEGTVKALTGGDAIPARGLYAKSSVEIVPTWTSFMPTNHLPIIKGSDHAIWRRIMPVPFARNFDTDQDVAKDPDRETRLMEEYEGILAWCVEGAIEYRKKGLRPPKAVREARMAYKRDMDLLSDWLEQCCEESPNYFASSASLWSSWKNYAEANGLLNYVRSSVSLGRKLPARFEAGKIGGERGYFGLRIKDDMLALDDEEGWEGLV